MNRIHSITPCSFESKYNYTVYGKQNKQTKFLYNHVQNLVSENKIPATFFVGPEDKIVLSPASENAASVVTKALNKLGINFSKEVEK